MALRHRKWIGKVFLSATMGATLIVSHPAEAEPPHRPDTFIARLSALALVETLNAEILGSRSATTTLEAWCASHGMASPATLKAVRITGADIPPTDEQRRRLAVSPQEPVRYRKVQLSCGGRILSEADNWYVPSRLTPAMNTALETSDVPFGRVVAPLKPTRQTFAVALLWHPLPEGWEMHAPPTDRPDQTLKIPPVLFEHSALLYTADHLPFSEVDEHYTAAILAFDAPS